jgi:hypothetical protein
VRVVHGAGESRDRLSSLGRRHCPAAQCAFEASAVDVFKVEVRLTLVLADLVDPDDVAVLQFGSGFRLGAETPQLLFPGL